MRTLFMAAITAAVFVSGGWAQTPDDTPPKISVVKRPEAIMPTTLTAKVGELIRLAGDKPAARWELTPSDQYGDIQPDGKGGCIFAASRSGVYTLVCYAGTAPASWAIVTVGDGIIPGPNPPGPTPPDPPGPTPNPNAGPIKKFVVVENTLKAGQWRSEVLGSLTVATFYKANALTHRLIDVNAPEGADDEAAAFLKAAVGKELPYLWTFDAGGKQIFAGPAMKTPDGFVAQLAASIAPHKRSMGNRPPPTNRLKAKWVEFGSTPKVPLIPRASWKPVDLGVFLPDVKDQDGVGACNAFAGVEAVEWGRAVQGLPYRRLSPGYLYGNINGQRDDGSLLEDGMQWLMDNGTCLASTVPELAWRKNQWPANAAAEAKDYVVLEAYVCPDFDSIASALQQGFGIVEGLAWYDNFEPDAEGWLPARGRGQWGGHALFGYGLEKRGNVWGIKTRNSWGPTWGVKGNCIIPETLFGSAIGGFWAVRAVKQTGNPFPVTPLQVQSRVNKVGTEPAFPLAP